MYITRQELFEELWKRSVKSFVEENDLNYAKTLRAIRDANIPRPPRQYMVNLQYRKPQDPGMEVPELTGNPFEVIFLPGKLPMNEDAIQTSLETGEMPMEVVMPKEALLQETTPEPTGPIDFEKNPRWHTMQFLSEEERKSVIEEAEQIQVRSNRLLHPMAKQYQRELNAWLRECMVFGDNYPEDLPRPLYADTVSSDSLLRIAKILNAIYRSITNLGGTVNPDYTLLVHDQVVELQFTEAKSKKPHKLTLGEMEAEREYREQLQENPKKAKKPKVKKWDFVYSGKLTLTVGNLYQIKDAKTRQLEDCLGDVLELIYTLAHSREITPEQDKKVSPEAKRRIKDRELERTEELVQLAEDYERSVKIRRLIRGVHESLREHQTEFPENWGDWAAWASAKADWLDPTVAAKDAILGKRHAPILEVHSKDA